MKEQLLISDANLKKDPNTELENLVKALEYCLDKGKLAPHINVQADNCAREMRNQTTLKFGIALRLLDIVETCTFNYLRKGHTHEDIGSGWRITACSLLFITRS